MKIRNIALLLTGAAFLSSCEYQKYNKMETPDPGKNSTWVYGVHPDSAARQLAQTYEPNPDMDLRVNAIFNKLYASDSTVSVPAK